MHFFNTHELHKTHWLIGIINMNSFEQIFPKLMIYYFFILTDCALICEFTQGYIHTREEERANNN